jgi:hypothetical protein
MSPHVSLAAAAVLAVLAPVPAAAQRDQSDADTREVRAYRLTMPKLRALNAAYADLERQREADPAYRALQQKLRELAALNEKDELTDAEAERAAQLEEEIAQAEEAEEGEDLEDQSLAGMVARMNADPRIAGALKRAGLDAREAVTMQLALVQALLAAELMADGTLKEIPKDVNAENVRFCQANKAEIATLMALTDPDKE